MKIEILIFEKKKQESFYKKAIDEYAKRLTRYCSISYKIIKKEKEWRKLLEQKKEGILVKAGSSVSSEEFSHRLKAWELSGEKIIPFYIMEEEECEDWLQEYPQVFTQVFSLSNYKMCPMMEALILYEQIYRGYRIMYNHPYHK